MEDIDIGTSPLQSQSQSQTSIDEEQQRPGGRGIASDSIEVDSYADSLMSEEEGGKEDDPQNSLGDHKDDAGRGGEMRRRDDATDSPDNDAMIINAYSYKGGDGAATSLSAPLPPPKKRRLSTPPSPARLVHSATDSDSDAQYDEERGQQAHEDPDEEHNLQDKERTRASAQQPTFQPAPRFKPIPDEQLFTGNHPSGRGGSSAAASILLTAPFSPERRGSSTYLSGGMASQLQGLLSQVKRGWSETATPVIGGVPSGSGAATAASADRATVRLVVEEIVPGTRMHLVKGRVLSEREFGSGGGALRNYILAGGEGTGGMVQEGSVLRIMAAPAWDIYLGEDWTVACEWTVDAIEAS